MAPQGYRTPVSPLADTGRPDTLTRMTFPAVVQSLAGRAVRAVDVAPVVRVVDEVGRNVRRTVPDDVARVAEDAAYVAIGFGVLTVQRLQVRRREVARTVANRRRSQAGSSN